MAWWRWLLAAAAIWAAGGVFAVAALGYLGRRLLDSLWDGLAR